MKTKKQGTRDKDRYSAPLIALAVIAAWTSGLVVALSTDLTSLPLALASLFALVAILWQTFFSTGLFITAHDAMHGTACPASRPINDALGRTALLLYALFSLSKLRKAHALHHQHPASAGDPDYHEAARPGPVAWYFHFLLSYLSLWQVLGMALIFNLLHHALGVALPNLLLFWVLPCSLSTAQLFYFGTYLPHRGDPATFADHHHARSQPFPPWLSFLTCYHFGYHHEHHLAPHIPWWQLPSYRQRNQSGTPH